jgi:hypothetical protein
LTQLPRAGNQRYEWGWRLNLGLAALPALLLTAGTLLVPETPNSLVERGHEDRGRAVLQRIRGTDGEARQPRVADCRVLTSAVAPGCTALHPDLTANFTLPTANAHAPHTCADVAVEFEDLTDAAKASRRMTVNPWRAIFSRRFRPQLIVLVALQVFNQMDAINTIMFYDKCRCCMC